MLSQRWKIGGGLAGLAMGLWLVPVAWSGFSVDVPFRTAQPVQTEQDQSDEGEEESGAQFRMAEVFSGVSGDQAAAQQSFGSTSAGDYSLGMIGDMTGASNGTASYSGIYTVSYDGGTDIVSAGTFQLQAAGDGDGMALAATLNEQSSASGFDGLNFGEDGLNTLTGTGDGSNFAAALGSSGGGVGGGVGATPDDLLAQLLADLEEAAADGGTSVTAVPEPTSAAALGLLGLGAMAYRRRGRRRHSGDPAAAG